MRSARSRHPRRGYVVVENTPGYLPESEPAVFRTKREAQSYVVSLEEELREAGYHRTMGSAKVGQVYFERDAHDLGRVIEVSEMEPGDVEAAERAGEFD